MYSGIRGFTLGLLDAMGHDKGWAGVKSTIVSGFGMEGKCLGLQVAGSWTSLKHAKPLTL